MAADRSRAPLLRVGEIRIDGDLDDLQLILRSHGQRELVRYRLTPEMVFKLAIEIPRCADRLANGPTSDNFAGSEDEEVQVAP